MVIEELPRMLPTKFRFIWASGFRKDFQNEFEDTKRAIRIRISKNNKHNGQKKKYKRTNNDQQNIHINLKIE